MREGSIEIKDKVVIYGLDDECFLIADEIEMDGHGIGIAKQFNISGNMFQVDTDTSEVKKIGRRTIVYRVEVDMLIDPEE